MAKAASSEAALSDLEDAEEGGKEKSKREICEAGYLSCACWFSFAAPASDPARQNFFLVMEKRFCHT